MNPLPIEAGYGRSWFDAFDSFSGPLRRIENTYVVYPIGEVFVQVMPSNS